MAHRCAEWDGWEEGLVESILGPEEYEEEEWIKGPDDEGMGTEDTESQSCVADSSAKIAECEPISLSKQVPLLARNPKVPVLMKETEKEQMLDMTGDICGGRGGELGRRLEAWLTDSGGTR
jgi:hypothetical protein